MDCVKTRALIYDYTKNELKRADMDAANGHLNSCASCAAFLSEITAIKTRIREEMVDPPPRVLQALRKKFAPARTVFYWLRPALAASTAVIIGLGIFFYSSAASAKKNALSNFILDNYSVTDQAYYDNTEFEQTAYIFTQDEL
jgi:anti-sigma factor RsiW